MIGRSRKPDRPKVSGQKRILVNGLGVGSQVFAVGPARLVLRLHPLGTAFKFISEDNQIYRV